GNVFQSVTALSSAIHVVESSLRVSWHSVFAVMANTFLMEGGNSTLINLGGSRHFFVAECTEQLCRGDPRQRCDEAGEVLHFIFLGPHVWSPSPRLCFRATTCREAWLCFIQLFPPTFTTTLGCS
ncbi:dispersed gene family protein 1 (DGF-1), partial [Trypanosoma cruzi]